MQGAQKKDLQREKRHSKTQGATYKNLQQKMSVSKASSAKLTIEGEGDAFQLKSQSHTKVTHETENQRTISSSKLAHQTNARGRGDVFSQWQ
jgi:hypothetical protein